MAAIETQPYASIRPDQSLDLLSRQEMAVLANTDKHVHRLFRKCALAVLNSGAETDDTEQVLKDYSNFDVKVIPEPRGLRLEIYNAPLRAFVDGNMILGIRNHLFSALRDIVYVHHELVERYHQDLCYTEGITDIVFGILRHANVVRSNIRPKLIVCWGGHSISRTEYDFSKDVGYELGLRGFDIATGCGPGAMKGPMKGATIGHAKQFKKDSRYVGITEPGIIAAESPNPIVNELVILPDIEKRLEAFVRLAHGVIVFPGGVGTAEEILYLLAIKMHPDNADTPLPLIMAAPESSTAYFEQIDHFLQALLGEDVRRHYEVITGDAAAVARQLRAEVKRVRQHRLQTQESFSYNWGLKVPQELQQPFEPTHENMAALQLHREQAVFQLMAELRKAFSGIVAGNVKESGTRAVAAHGPYQLSGDADVIERLSGLLQSFADQGRMKIDAASYRPCFEIVP